MTASSRPDGPETVDVSPRRTKVAGSAKASARGRACSARRRASAEAIRPGVEDRRLPHAADLADENVAVRLDPAGPAALGLLGDGVHPLGEHRRQRGAVGIVGVGQRSQRAGERRLLDRSAVVAGVQAGQQASHGARLLDQSPQIRAGAHLAAGELQRRALEAGLDQVVVERPLVLQVLLGLAALDLEQRRLGDEEIAVLDHLPHLAEEEGEQQRADVRAVHVRVGHDDDLVVAKLLDVEIVAPDAGAERGDQRADLLATTASCRSAPARR